MDGKKNFTVLVSEKKIISKAKHERGSKTIFGDNIKRGVSTTDSNYTLKTIKLQQVLPQYAFPLCKNLKQTNLRNTYILLENCQSSKIFLNDV